MASRAVYSLHKSSTRDHVLSKAKEWGAEGRCVWSASLKNAFFVSRILILSFAGCLRSWDMTFLQLTSTTRKPLLTFKLTLSDSPPAKLLSQTMWQFFLLFSSWAATYVMYLQLLKERFSHFQIFVFSELIFQKSLQDELAELRWWPGWLLSCKTQ